MSHFVTNKTFCCTFIIIISHYIFIYQTYSTISKSVFSCYNINYEQMLFCLKIDKR
jgi:hypothetical protein